ncbi:hypothetical protein ABEB36_001889 [Hypothenemus hampei]|uniref:CDK5 regulatory subunit-associated protein 3 n=1 Tax=Hypothenemus hampei TaxID=57062 RepID=A0ABD1FG51_HYPHA
MDNAQDIPIDINTTKLLDWLVSRRHVPKDWQSRILNVREKISNAIQDMPAHEDIVKLVIGQHINYFHCLKITEILKETEKDSKNIFGMYGSQRMKDWQEILNLYQKDNIYLAEAATMLIRNVSYEIPSLKKQKQKLQQMQSDTERKIKDCNKTEAMNQREFNASCEQLGIKGVNIKSELLELLKGLPRIYEEIGEKFKIVAPAIEFYKAFSRSLLDHGVHLDILPTLTYIIEHGNTTTYEFVYGEKPVTIEEPDPIFKDDETSTNNDANEIDFGDAGIDFGSSNETIDFGDQIIIETPENVNQIIDTGSSKASSNEESFEIVDYTDLTQDESGIVIEKTGGVARNEYALTLLDNPKYREQILNELTELRAFLEMRLFEMAQHDSDLLSMSQMQGAPALLQMQTQETVTTMTDCANVALALLTDKRVQHLHNVKHSLKYVDILTESLKHKLGVIERVRRNKKAWLKKIEDCGTEIRRLDEVIGVMIDKTRELQLAVQEDIAKKYKGRIVNIVGGINNL